MIRNAISVGGFTLLSRLFGFVRDIVMAAALGVGPMADAFMVAFRLPNHFRAILAEGAFNSAFVPTYSGILAKEGEAGAVRFRNRIFSWLALANLVLLALGMGLTGWLIAILAPGFSDDAEQAALAAELTRITFPSLFCLSIVTLLSGVLNAHGRFAAAAAAPILLNIALIATLLAAQLFPSAAHAAAWGVLAGALAELALLVAAAFGRNLAIRPAGLQRSPELVLFARRFAPALIGAGAVQIAVFADTIIASFLPTGALSFLYYADRLYQLPLAVIGIALGTAILPDLSRREAAGDAAGSARQLSRAATMALLVGLPASLLLSTLGDWLIAILFQRGRFDSAAVAGSAAVLASYAAGLAPAIALRALVAGFHAQGDTSTPVKILGAATLVNLALKAMLAGSLGAAGLAVGTAAGVWVYAGLLAMILARRGRLAPERREKRVVLVALGATAILLAAIFLVRAPVATVLAPIVSAVPLALPLLAIGTASLVFYGGAVALAWRRGASEVRPPSSNDTSSPRRA